LFIEHDVLLLLYGADSILHKSFLKPALKPKTISADKSSVEKSSARFSGFQEKKFIFVHFCKYQRNLSKILTVTLQERIIVRGQISNIFFLEK